jgi:hypothetical protein
MDGWALMRENDVINGGWKFTREVAGCHQLGVDYALHKKAILGAALSTKLV